MSPRMQPRNDKSFTLCSNSAWRYGFSETLSTIFPRPSPESSLAWALATCSSGRTWSMIGLS
jgi:hypothetical protein